MVENATFPEPKRDWVRIKIQACGMACHSDMLLKEGYWPGVQYPRVPGHEVAGVIDQVGENVTAWKKAAASVGVGVVWRALWSLRALVAGAIGLLPGGPDHGIHL